MPGPPSSGPQGPPPFAPPVEAISALSLAIQKATSEYESAQTPTEKTEALQKIQRASTKLSKATMPIQQQFMELNLGPNVNVAVRIAIEMRLFSALLASGEPLEVTKLAEAISAEPELVLRISRTLHAFNIVVESLSSAGVQEYRHTPLSRFLATPPAEASARHLFDNMLQSQVLSAGSYYRENGFKEPVDSKNSPFAFAQGVQNADFFQILQMKPDRMAIFNSAMTITAVLGLLVKSYPFDKLEPNSDGVILVDVGGGKGHVINELRAAYSHLTGKYVLQDLKVVLEGGTVVPENEVTLQPYDFFKEEQPVKGSNYFCKAIFHDWPDKDCLQILKNLAPAMKGHPTSRLLICDLVLPDHNADADKVLRDMNMLLITGKERNVSQWNSLLGKGGFKILEIHGLGGAHSSIIEVVYEG